MRKTAAQWSRRGSSRWQAPEQSGNGDPDAEAGDEVLGLSIVRESLLLSALLSARGLTPAATRLLHLFACLSDTAVPYRLLARPGMLTETPLFAGVPLEQIRLAIGGRRVGGPGSVPAGDRLTPRRPGLLLSLA